LLLPALALMALTVAAQQPKPPPKAPPPKRQPAPAPKVEAPLPPADEEQKVAAGLTYLGQYACEFNQSVTVTPDPKDEGYIGIRFKQQLWVMKPVLSRTGALRLEDVKGRMLMVQIADKSMLMDVQTGHRVVDDCQHETQRANMAARKAAGTPTDSIGIDPAKTAAAAATAAAAQAASAATPPAVAAAPAASATPASAPSAPAAAEAAASNAASAAAP
jgi:hypothetical protein